MDLGAILGWPFKKYFGHVLLACESHRHSKLHLMSFNSCFLSVNQTSAGKTSELTALCQIRWPRVAGSNAAISFKSVVETITPMSWRRSCPPPPLTTSFWIPLTDPMIPDFVNFVFNWRIIASQGCVGFCLRTMSISYKCTHVPSLWSLSPTPYSIAPLQGVTGHWPEPPVSDSSFPLAVYFTCDSIHEFQCYSQSFPCLSAPHCSATTECAVPSRQEEGCLASGLLCLGGSEPVRKMSQGPDWRGPWLPTLFTTWKTRAPVKCTQT